MVANVLPFYHKKNVKRLAGKLYFAATVKGISAYTGMLLILFALQVPSWIMISVAVSFWVFNLSISDKVLKAAMDAREIHNPEILAIANQIFKKAGISKVEIYETESSDYNALATGLNIGRSMVTITSATLKLPNEVIAGIIAHEAIHVKKRDILWGQIYRMLMLGIFIVGGFYFLNHYEQ